MDATEQLKQDVREGRVDIDRCVDLAFSLGRQLHLANQRIAELEKQLGRAGTVKTAEPYSLRAQEQRQAARGNKPAQKNQPLRRGRVTTADKIKLAQRTEKVYPDAIAPQDCKLSHTRPLWRLENGRAVLLAYEVYRGPKNQYGKIPGTLGRSEFGIEFIIAVAYQVFIVGLSFDKVCLMMNFFQNLQLRKSQADALLNQLSKHWEKDFDRLCTLLANSAVVHTDETSWSIRSAWAFLSEKVRVVFFGVHKDAATLKQILDPATFTGVVVSDDAAVYANFTQSQKCWAHLLRKAFKLTLLDPQNSEYRTLADRLLAIYRSACRIQCDKRLSDTGRAKKVALVAGTNNEAERTLRAAADARKTGRTSKTLSGARRRTIVVSLLESLRPHVPNFTLSSVIAEIRQWTDSGISRFEKLLTEQGLMPQAGSILDRVLAPLSG